MWYSPQGSLISNTYNPPLWTKAGFPAILQYLYYFDLPMVVTTSALSLYRLETRNSMGVLLINVSLNNWMVLIMLKKTNKKKEGQNIQKGCLHLKNIKLYQHNFSKLCKTRSSHLILSSHCVYHIDCEL